MYMFAFDLSKTFFANTHFIFISVADMFVFVDKGHKAQHQFLSTTLYYFNIFKAENLQA